MRWGRIKGKPSESHGFSPGTANRTAHPRPRGRGYLAAFFRHYLSGLPVLLVLMLAGQFMEQIGLFDSMNNVFLDTFLQTRTPKMENGVLILEINNDDYKKYFHATSPLDPDTITALVTTISSGGPAVIGVDLDTSDEPWCTSLERASPAVMNTLTGDQIVWAEVPETVEEPLKLKPVLGGKLTAADNVGIPRFPLERDGMVRRYTRKFKVAAGGLPPCRDKQAPYKKADSTTPAESLSMVIVHKWCGKPHTRADSEATGLFCDKVPDSIEDQAILNLKGRDHLLINDIADFMLPPEPDPATPLTPAQKQAVQEERNKAQAEIQTRLPLLQNRIVLIGGNYQAARDIYFTPVGEKAGVELVAEAILADLTGEAANPVKPVYAITFDFLIGSFVVWLYFHLHESPRTAFWLSLGLIPLLLFGVPGMTKTGYWLDASSIIVGVILDQLVELTDRIKDYEETCGAFEAEVRELRSQVNLNSAREEQTEAIVPFAPAADPTATLQVDLSADEASTEKNADPRPESV